MEKFRFIDFVHTPTAKQLGVVLAGIQTAIGEIMLGFKVVERKDGSGFFFGEPTWKYEENGEEQWKPWIMIDSNIAKEQLFSLLRENVNKCLHKIHGQDQQQYSRFEQEQPQQGRAQVQQQQSVFANQEDTTPF